MEEIEERFKPYVRNDVPLSNPVELIKTIFVSMFILPVRILFFMIWFGLYLIFMKIGTKDIKDYSKPISKEERYWFDNVLDTFDFIFGIRLSDFYSICLGFPCIRVTGNNKMESDDGVKTNLIISNHSSWIDIYMLMVTAEKLPGFVSKVEIKKVPVIGWLSQAWQCVYVDRVNGKGIGTSQLIAERANDFDFPPVVVFPEGTTSNGKYFLKFKSGAFVSGAPVKPVIITYPSTKYSPCYESEKFLTHFFRVMTQFVNYCHVHYLPVYVPSEEEKEDPKLYALNLSKYMSKYSSQTLTESSYDDKRDYLKLIRGGVQ
eukprot:TRINITY_DN15063_c0_g1_i1.p1 TRINITY_DN15063_c0_g1~~TRINITY_DN15063_c0_g1_i1.p1  ORF type:complete len:317 (+),score=97.39 TRINITY_DN15063_c0_g1_i1:65-1015(+)